MVGEFVTTVSAIPLIQARGKLVHRGASLKKDCLAIKHQTFRLARNRLLFTAVAMREVFVGRLKFVLDMRETAPPCERTSTPACSSAARSRLTVAAVTPRALHRSENR